MEINAQGPLFEEIKNKPIGNISAASAFGRKKLGFEPKELGTHLIRS